MIRRASLIVCRSVALSLALGWLLPAGLAGQQKLADQWLAKPVHAFPSEKNQSLMLQWLRENLK